MEAVTCSPLRHKDSRGGTEVIHGIYREEHSRYHMPPPHSHGQYQCPELQSLTSWTSDSCCLHDLLHRYQCSSQSSPACNLKIDRKRVFKSTIISQPVVTSTFMELMINT